MKFLLYLMFYSYVYILSLLRLANEHIVEQRRL
jgi:hypothetical protein